MFVYNSNANCVARSFTQIVVEFVGARETKSYSYLLNISIYVKHVSIALTSSRLKVYAVISFERSSLLACRLSNLCSRSKAHSIYLYIGWYVFNNICIYITTEID